MVIEEVRPVPSELRKNARGVSHAPALTAVRSPASLPLVKRPKRQVARKRRRSATKRPATLIARPEERAFAVAALALAGSAAATWVAPLESLEPRRFFSRPDNDSSLGPDTAPRWRLVPRHQEHSDRGNGETEHGQGGQSLPQ